MPDSTESPLSPEECADFQRLAGIMLPEAADYGAPGADDAAIFADIVRSLGRDLAHVRRALAALRAIGGGPFVDLQEDKAEAAAMALLAREGAETAAVGRAVLQCYYRDDRVVRSLGREARPPYPIGYTLEEGDFGLLDAVRGRPRMWRDLDGLGRD